MNLYTESERNTVEWHLSQTASASILAFVFLSFGCLLHALVRMWKLNKFFTGPPAAPTDALISFLSEAVGIIVL